MGDAADDVFNSAFNSDLEANLRLTGRFNNMNTTQVPPNFEEPPPPSGEADYASGGKRRNFAGGAAIIGAAEPFGINDVPIPMHLIDREPTPELNEAWARVLEKEHESIPKTGHNKFFGYRYATADDIRKYVGKTLGENGLYYEQHVAGFTPWGHLIRVTYYFVVRHKSGESSPPIRHDELAKTTTEKGFPDDKALGKVGVLALKNWSKEHFSIDTGDLTDDPDGDGPVGEPPADQGRITPQNRPAARSGAPAGSRQPAQTKPPEDFAARATAALEGERDSMAWLETLRAILADVRSLDELASVRTIPSFKVFMRDGPAKFRSEIDSKVREIAVKFAPPDDVHLSGEAASGGEAKASAEADGLAKGKQLMEEALQKATNALKAPTADEDDGWPGPRD